MKRFLNWTGAKLNWFFGSWRFPAAFLAFALLVVLFYAEEDWRGAHRWAVNKAKWEAKGETFDYAKFIPPPVPDGQNLAAIPLFKLEPRSKTDSYLDPIVLQKAMRQGVSNYNLPPTNSGKPDGLPDLPKMRAAIAENYALVFPGTKPPGSALAQLDALYPFLRNFLAAAATRPLCRLPGDYNTSPPAERPLGVVVAGIGLSRILTYQAILALDEHQPDLALADIKANYIVLSGVKRDPTLVGGLVGIGMMVIAQAALAEGFAQHAWNDEQLVEIDQMLKPIHFLDDYQFALKCEAAESSANIDWIKTQGAKEWIHRLGQTDFYVPATVLFAASWPRGWWDDNKSQTTDFYFREMSTIDPRRNASSLNALAN